MPEQRVPFFRFRNKFELAEAAHQFRAVGHPRQVEQARAQGPPILSPLSRAAIRIAPRIGGIVERAGIDERPIEEILLGIVRVLVGVEDIGDRKLAGGKDEIVRRARAAEFVGIGIDLLALAAEIESLSEEQPLQPEIGRRLADLVRLATGKSRNAQRIAQAKSLIDFRVSIQRAILPEAHTDKRGRIEGFIAHALWRKAVRAPIGRMECRMILLDEGRLCMQAEPIGSIRHLRVRRCGNEQQEQRCTGILPHTNLHEGFRVWPLFPAAKIERRPLTPSVTSGDWPRNLVPQAFLAFRANASIAARRTRDDEAPWTHGHVRMGDA